MDTITHDDYLAARKADPYYAGRWVYFQEVITLVGTLKPGSVLELGPYKLPIVKGSDTMDKIDADPVLNYKDMPKLTYRHDANCFPWPAADKSYDLLMALQVWEHLINTQEDAFREVMRISRAAILSFPYMWPQSQGHHANIGEEKIAEWTLHFSPRKVIKAGDKIIYYFVF